MNISAPTAAIEVFVHPNFVEGEIMESNVAVVLVSLKLFILKSQINKYQPNLI